MKVKKIPLRTCVITKEKFPKNELLRIVRTHEGKIEVDLTGKLNGHGAYIKKDKDVVIKATKNKALERYLETPIEPTIYEEIIKIIEVENGE